MAKATATEVFINTRQAPELKDRLTRASELTGIKIKRLLKDALEEKLAKLQAEGYDLTPQKEET